MKRRFGTAIALCATTILTATSCDVSSPDRFTRAPVIKQFSPGGKIVDTFVGDTVSFSITAVDPEDKALSYSFSLGDSVVSGSPVWEYAVDDTGTALVTGTASNGPLESAITWTMNSVFPENLPPVILEAHPVESKPSIIVGDKIEFSINAEDPEGMRLDYIFTVNDSTVSAARAYTYQSGYVGTVDIKGVVSDGERFVSHSWELLVLAEPDSIPPAAVNLVSVVTGIEPGELVVQWQGVGEDSMEGLPSHYEVRTSSIPIENQSAWNNASSRPNVPVPLPPGEIHMMTIDGLNPAGFVFVAVRAVDDFGNFSPLGTTLGAFAKGLEVFGTVRDAVTNLPVPGIQVRLASLMDTTDVDGRYGLTELPASKAEFRLKDEQDTQEIGAYFDILTDPWDIVETNDADFWVIPNVAIDSDLFQNFLWLFKQMTDTHSHPFGNLLRTWNAPFDVYVPPFTKDGLDYQQVIKEKFLEWEAASGMDLIEFVDSQPDTGVFVEINNGVTRDVYSVVKIDFDTLPVLGKISIQTIYDLDDLNSFRRLAAHETGHAFGIMHSSDPIHVMVGGQFPVVSNPSPDESLLLRAMYHMPRGIDLNWYRFE